MQKLIQQIHKHQSFEMAASMSFYLSICIAPLSLLILSTLSILGLTEKISITQQIQNTLSPVVIDVLEILYKDKNQALKQGFLSSLISLSLLLFSSSLFFNHIKKSIRKIFNYTAHKPRLIFYIIKQRFVAIALSLIFLLTVVGSLILSVLFKQLPLPGFIDYKWIQIVGSQIAFFLLFFIVYRLALKSYVHIKYQALGAAITSASIQLGQYLFSIYTSIIPLKTIYGPVSLFVGFLLWCYLFCISIILSAQVTEVYKQSMKL